MTGGALSIRIAVPGKVLPWARAGAMGKRRFTPKPQADYAATIRSIASAEMAGRPLITGPVTMKMMAVFPWPKSMSAKKRAAIGADLKATKPDVDNLAKLVKDALNQIVYVDDSQIASLHAWKRLGDHPGLTVEIIQEGVRADLLSRAA